MRKCVKIVLTDFVEHCDSVENLYKMLKKNLSFDNVEGVVQPFSEDEVHLVVYGPKARVDDLVDALEEAVIREGATAKHMMGFSVEPFLKDEDYRGVFRFVQRA